MKEIIDRLQENRQIELAKSILESKGYRVTKDRLEESTNDKYTTAQHIEDIKNFLRLPMEMSLSWNDMKSNPRDTDYSQEYFDKVESMLGGSDIVIYSSESYDYDEGDFSPAYFEPLQYAEFYRGNSTKIEIPGDNSGLSSTLIKSPVGTVLQQGGWGISYVHMTSETRDKVIRYLDKSGDSLSSFLSKWSEYYSGGEYHR